LLRATPVFILIGLTSLLAGGAPRAALALETDQFTVPPSALADVGPELAAEVVRRIDVAVERVNARAAAHAKEAAAVEGFWQRHHLRERDLALSEWSLALEVYREVAGPGLPECHIERWMRTHRFARGPARFDSGIGSSAYGASPFARSPFIVDLSPTVNAYGVYCGVDKIGHVFQQGHQYFEEFAWEESRCAARGERRTATAAALAQAVRRGVGQERGLFGETLVGVYSNADLAANYAGLKLYLNLTRPVRVGAELRPPLFVKWDGQWVPNAAVTPAPSVRTGVAVSPAQRRADAFLRPFVTEHFNEALNPSRYTDPTRQTVRTHWRERAASWVTFYRSTRATEVARLNRLATWYGEPYGHSGLDALVTAADTCFDDTPSQQTHVAIKSSRAHPGTAEPGSKSGS
jgi:hypothetical protein